MPRRKVKFPCAICEKSTACRQDSIECVGCGLWVHAKCARLSTADIASYGSSDEFFLCRICILDDNQVNYLMLLKRYSELIVIF